MSHLLLCFLVLSDGFLCPPGPLIPPVRHSIPFFLDSSICLLCLPLGAPLPISSCTNLLKRVRCREFVRSRTSIHHDPLCHLSSHSLMTTSHDPPPSRLPTSSHASSKDCSCPPSVRSCGPSASLMSLSRPLVRSGYPAPVLLVPSDASPGLPLAPPVRLWFVPLALPVSLLLAPLAPLSVFCLTLSFLLLLPLLSFLLVAHLLLTFFLLFLFPFLTLFSPVLPFFLGTLQPPFLLLFSLLPLLPVLFFTFQSPSFLVLSLLLAVDTLVVAVLRATPPVVPLRHSALLPPVVPLSSCSPMFTIFSPLSSSWSLSHLRLFLVESFHTSLTQFQLLPLFHSS